MFSRSVVAAVVVGSSVMLGGCDLLEGDGGQGDGPFLEVEMLPGDAVVVDASVALWADVRWSGALLDAKCVLDGAALGEPTFDVVDDVRYAICEVASADLALGAHRLELDVAVGDLEETASYAFDLQEGVLLDALEIDYADTDGQTGGALEAEVHLYDASTEAWLGCAALDLPSGVKAEHLAIPIRDGGRPLLRRDLEGSQVFAYVVENDGVNACEPASVGDPTNGDDDDLIGESPAFAVGDASLSFSGAPHLAFALGFGG